MKESVIHVWDVHEIVLHAENTYDNPYTDVTVWADLKGPGFDKRVYGFWDGGDTWRIRVTATSPGTWTYITVRLYRMKALQAYPADILLSNGLRRKRKPMHAAAVLYGQPKMDMLWSMLTAPPMSWWAIPGGGLPLTAIRG